MIYLVYTLNFLFMILLPVMIARYIKVRRKPSWALWGMGAVTFVASQVGHIPFNWLILQRLEWIPTDTAVFTSRIILALFLGLSSGLFEEVARYVTYRFWATDARTWGKGLMLGIGHGGIEAILLGVLGLVNVGVLALMAQGMFLDSIPADQMPLVERQITATFSVPWYLVFLGALERVFAICAHLAMSVMVLQVFVRGQKRWLAASILWHALLNATAVFAATTWNPIVTEGLIGVLAVVSLGIIFWLRTPEPVAPELEPLPPVGPLAEPLPVAQTVEMLEKSKYNS